MDPNTTSIPERLYPDQPEWVLYGHQHLQRYQLALPYALDRRVLDAACGCGYGAFVLAHNGARAVTGLDISDEAISYAKGHYQSPALSFHLHDVCATGFSDGHFEVITSFETIEHLTDPAVFVAQLARQLAPGGHLLISAPNALTHGRSSHQPCNPYHLSEPDYETLRAWLLPHFEIRQEWEQTFVLPDRVRELRARLVGLEAGQPRSALGVLDRLEQATRRLLGRSPGRNPPPPAEASAALVTTTELVPLLPERRAVCDTFVFVGRKRPV